ADAPDGKPLELRRRGHEYRIRAGGQELMSNEDEPSSRSLAELGCAHIAPGPEVRVLVGGLGMGFTLRAALDLVGKGSVEVAELVPAVVEWNEGPLGPLAGHPLRDPCTVLYRGDVRDRIRAASSHYDAILLDVDNGPIALAHAANDALYGRRGIAQCWEALKPGGVLGVWSLLDDQRYTTRLRQQGFDARAQKVFGSRKDRGREHVIWVAQKSQKPQKSQKFDKARKPRR
ncbi:MAG: spermidine synthase, partial [Deltaproteobacteria bacterium]|nr:spermidine synthase [Deltaproteobacteria bacterium]